MNIIEQQLTDAMNYLTPDTWIQGKMLIVKDNVVCGCAHGVVQLQTNPALKQCQLIQYDLVRDTAICASYIGYQKMNVSLIAWDLKPSFISETKFSNGLNLGDLRAHYLLGMVGLISSFNDSPQTTLAMIKEKFQQAIDLARELNV